MVLHNQDFLKDSNFDVTTIFDTLFSGDVLLPSSLPNLPVSTRLSYRNKCFVQNFVGLCIWKHINNGDTWVKRNDLVVEKNPENVKKFLHHAKVMKELYNDQYWKFMDELDIKVLDPKTLFNFSNNTRNLIKVGSWDKESDKIEGIYFMWKNMLERIGFKMNNSSLLLTEN